MASTASTQDTTCCGALQGLWSLRTQRRRSPQKAMLPAPTYLQHGAKCTAGHRTANSNSGLIRLYEVHDDTLGEGSFGVVRATKSRKTGTACVMKTISKASMNEEMLTLLANEIAIQEMCDHPNIARIYESFEDPDEIHIAMEACHGGDVFDYLHEQEGSCVREGEAKVLLQELLQAVFYLHSVKHVAHRDIKPENLLLKYRNVPMKDQVVKLIDFGFAQSFTPGTPDLREVCGTPVYMAPEIVEQRYDERCDVWSCGIALHELLSGGVPFNCTSPQKLLMMAGSRPIRLSGPEWDNVSETAKALVHSMLNKRPGQRPTAGEALQHEWFKGSPRTESEEEKEEEEEGEDVLGEEENIAQNLRAFTSLSGFQKAALRLAAYRLDDEQVQRHRSAFRALDANGDGLLTLDELDQGCPELGLSREEARRLFHDLDTDGSGSIEYTEFLGAAVCKDTLPKHACWEAFRVCDKDGSGLISAGEVDEVVGRLSSKDSQRMSSKDSAGSSKSTCAGRSVRSDSSQDLGEEMDFDKFMSLLRQPSKSQRLESQRGFDA